MAADSFPPPSRPADSDDNRSQRPDEVSRIYPKPSHVTTFVYDAKPHTPAFQFCHDQEKRLFILTWPDGTTQRFRDNPARQLVVEPDPETGALLPVTKNGRPVFVYSCREEREGG